MTSAVRLSRWSSADIDRQSLVGERAAFVLDTLRPVLRLLPIEHLMLPLTGSHVGSLAGGVASAPVKALLAAAIATDGAALGVEPGTQWSQTTLPIGALL